MAGRGWLFGIVGPILMVLLVLSSCVGTRPAASDVEGPAVPVAGRSASGGSPIVVDIEGVPLTAEHAEVVRAVHRALVTADLDALGALYAGDDWAGQAELLVQDTVRRSVLDSLRTHPANLGEGYVYPGFSVHGWAGPVERADGALLGVGPATVPDPTTGYPGYQTAFFLDYEPPRTSAGLLRWRGIAQPSSLL